MPREPINSLDRFRKRSARLVLEETTAGCGGVVFRWRNPHAAVPATVMFYAPVPAKLFLDGAQVQNSGIDLAPGPHQVALALEEIDHDGGLFLFAAWHVADPYHTSLLPPGMREQEWKVLSAPDGTWLASLDEPPSDWLGVNFDDSGWQKLTHERPTPNLGWREPGSHQAHWCKNQGARFLALSATARGKNDSGPIWVRKRLDVPGPHTA